MFTFFRNKNKILTYLFAAYICYELAININYLPGTIVLSLLMVAFIFSATISTTSYFATLSYLFIRNFRFYRIKINNFLNNF